MCSPRKLRAKEVHPPVLSQGELAKDAAMEVLASRGSLTVRQAASKHGVHSHSLISYWLKKWRATEMQDVAHSMASSTPSSSSLSFSSSSASGRSSSSLSMLMPATASELEAKSRKATHTVKREMLVEAVELTQQGFTLRQAASAVTRKYDVMERGISISHSSVKNYSTPGYEPAKNGKPSFLPDEFNQRLCEYVLALRSLRFPVFKDQVIGAANFALHGTTYLQSFKHKRLGNNWYYNSFLRQFSHRLGTSGIQPLEIDRARWATAKNIGRWYEMLADALVEAGVAVRNPDYDPEAAAGTTAAEPVFITSPDRIVSFDETRVEADMTHAARGKRERGLFDKHGPVESRRDVLANKGGLAATGVGGCAADGKALPGLFIFAATSYEQSWTTPSPRSGFLDSEGRYRMALFGCNKQGGMQDDIGVLYFEGVVAPCFPDRSPARPVVVICDGHSSHLTVDLIEWCRSNHFRIVLRVPHTSHITQGEDVVIFRSFKVDFRKEKVTRLAVNVSQRVHKLRNSDLMSCVTPAWESAFSTVNVLKAFRATGIVPFTRSVLFDLIEQERSAAALCGLTETIDYSRLNVSSFMGGHQEESSDGSSEEGEEDAEMTRLINKSRITSADLYSLGPITSDRAYSVVKERAEAKEAARKAKEARAQQRATKRTAGDVELVNLYHIVKDRITTVAALKSLSVRELKAVLHCVDNNNKKRHTQLKSKSTLVEYVQGLYPDLPAGEALSCPNRRKRKRGAQSVEDADEASEDESAGSSNENSELESNEDTYAVDKFVDACIRGRSYMLLVHWEGYGSDEDSWEPMSTMRETVNDMVEEFIATRKAAGRWPPNREV